MGRRALLWACGIAAGIALAILVAGAFRDPPRGEPVDSSPDRADAENAATPAPPSLQGRPVGSARSDAATAARGRATGPDAPVLPVPRISGRIVDGDGNPIHGAVVRWPGRTDPVAQTLTDEQGGFALDARPGAPENLVVTAPGFEEQVVAAQALAAVGPIALRKGWTITGTVEDAATAAPIVGVPVLVSPATSPESPLPSRAAWREDGSFSVAVPGPGAYALEVGERATLVPSDAAEWIPARLDGVAGGATRVRVALVRGLSIEGRIVDEAGDPVDCPVSVDAVARTAAGDLDYTARKRVLIDAGAGLRVPGLRAGRYDLWILPVPQPGAAGGAASSPTAVRSVEAGARGVLVRLERGWTLVGGLEDGAGGRVLGPGLVHAWREGETSVGPPVVGEVPGDGTFRVGPLAEGVRYDLRASGFDGRGPGIATGVSPRDRGVVIVLPGAGRIRGRIETVEGKPVPAGVPVGVVAQGTDPRATGTRVFAYSAQDGTFAVEGLVDLPFVVEAGGGRSGYVGAAATGVRPGATEIVLNVSLGVDLSGTLVDVKGDPVATTSLEADDGARMAAMRPYDQVGPDGRFLLRGLRAGRVRLFARVGQESIALGEVVAPGSDVKVTLPSK